MLVCPITSSVHFYHLVKAVSVRFLHCEITIALFLISTNLMQRFFESLWLLFLIRISPTSVKLPGTIVTMSVAK